MDAATIAKLKELRAKATPGKLKFRQHPTNEDMFFAEARTYEGHPYHGVTNGGFGLMEDEDYPTKRADVEYVIALWNALEEEL
jgi:hypothetical protein